MDEINKPTESKILRPGAVAPFALCQTRGPVRVSQGLDLHNVYLIRASTRYIYKYIWFY